MRHAIKDSKIQEVGDKEPDYELASPSQFFGSHVNLIPLHSSVQAPRLFYGARFIDQAMPLINPEAALVQNLDDQDPDGRSFDEHAGAHAGAIRSKHEGEVTAVEPGRIVIRDPDGNEQEHQIYDRFPFNRKSALHNTPVVKPGDKVTPGQLLAHSNFTDKDGTLAMGLNARIALIPYKGWSMDDAQVISESFARRLTSEATTTHTQDFDENVKGGLHHFKSLFPDKFVKRQMDQLDEHGVAKPGTVLQPGDPFILATRPKSVSSTSQALGRMSKTMRLARSDVSHVWDGMQPATVLDVADTKEGKICAVSYNSCNSYNSRCFYPVAWFHRSTDPSRPGRNLAAPISTNDTKASWMS